MKFPKPWFRKGRGWYVQIGTKQIFLDMDETRARDKYHVLMTRKGRGVANASPNGPTLAELVDRYAVWTKLNRAEATATLIAWRLQKLLDFLDAPALLAKDLRPTDLQKWVDAAPVNKKAKTKSPTTKRGLIMVVQTAYSWAVDNDLIESSPIARMRKPSGQARESHVAPTDFADLLAACRHESLRDIITVAWETGMRPHEVRIVEAKWVDGGKIVFPVRRSKGKKKARVVFLSETAASICERLGKRYPDGPIFRNKYGGNWTADALKCAMDRLFARTGKRFAMVDFRHGFATRKLKDGVGTITLAALMGHADGSMISKVYSHVHEDDEHLRAAVKS